MYQTYQTVPFKLMQFIIYPLSLSKAVFRKRAIYCRMEEYFSKLWYIHWVESFVAITTDL